MSTTRISEAEAMARPSLGRRLSWLIYVVACGASAGCKEASAAELIKDDATLPERTADGTVHWNVKSDGNARVVVTDEHGTVVKQGVTGQITYNAESGGESQTVNLELNPDTGILKADGPDLDKEVTELRYALIVNGKPRTGSLHVPESGTKGLRESAVASEKAGDEQGPHGGTIQVAGDKRYEVVGDSNTGQLRVYLDANAERPEHIKLALDTDNPRVVELHWHADGYFVAELDVQHPPRKTTLIVDDHDEAYVVLIGYRPGVFMVLDRNPIFWVHRDWENPGLARGHYKGTIYGPPGQGGGTEKVMIKEGKGGSKVHIKVH